MLLLAIAGGEDPTIAGGIEASARELELLYELCNSRGELWASGLLNQVQQRLRVLAELSRRRESRPPTPPVASA
ncbi:Hypothetical protein CAP_2230 [Chondromyces apiculatus DSM 436]|uniref:Uncharacterized protein n=2 Tax=Chondromyces apiculatus TaxID=51 RepID=A0A017TB72_9BACT|nr:Hypothetical protein CAP_2230 [Chondromyces apiculatus DSM 436]